MLVIRRRTGQSLLIGDGVEIEVLEISGSRVKLGIKAPQNVNVTRKEAEITRQENVAAADADPSSFLGLLGLTSS